MAVATPCLQFSQSPTTTTTTTLNPSPNDVVSLPRYTPLKTPSFSSSSKLYKPQRLICKAGFNNPSSNEQDFSKKIESRSPLMEAKEKAYCSVEAIDSPVTAKIEEICKTQVNYQRGLVKEPNNVLLLANYAQFLYLFARDFDRAEDYFKRAIKVEPKDAEAHNKYANFLWKVRNDLWAAEETFLEAISADPTNSYYAASYAHFLWNTGGEDTCFPLDSIDDDSLES